MLPHRSDSPQCARLIPGYLENGKRRKCETQYQVEVADVKTNLSPSIYRTPVLRIEDEFNSTHYLKLHVLAFTSECGFIKSYNSDSSGWSSGK